MKIYNLVYKNKESGEVKKFHRDDYRRYQAEDGTEISKSDAWMKWDFMGKERVEGMIDRHYAKRKSSSRHHFEAARERMRSLHYANEVGGSEKLETYLDGFIDCLNIFEGRD